MNTPPQPHSESAETIRQVFSFFDRFTAILKRFLVRELGIESDVHLCSVEDGTGALAPLPDRTLFGSVAPDLAVAAVIPNSFLMGIMDRKLGGRFRSDSSPHDWTELDESLTVPFVARLVEILLGYALQPSVPETLPEPVSVERIALPGLWYRLVWEIRYTGENWQLEMILPESTVSSAKLPSSIERQRTEDENALQHYVEMRRAASKINKETEETPIIKSDSALHHLRVLVGTFNMPRTHVHEMKSGDILTTDISSESPFRLLIDGIPSADVSPGENQGMKAVIVEGDK